MRIGQYAHLALLVCVAAVYALLKVVLPADDPDRSVIDAALAVVAAVWAAMVFVEALRGEAAGSLRERALRAYRRFLGRPSTLLASDLVLAGVLVGLLYLLVGYRAVDFYSVDDVEVYQNDPGAAPRRIGLLKPKVPASLRLRLGERWLVFYSTASVDQTVRREPVHTARLKVTPWWSEMKRVDVPEIHHYGPVH